MSIDNPEAIKFSNERVRPLAEKMRALKAEIDDTMIAWFNGMSGEFPNDSTPVGDGREAEGISRLTGEDVVGLVAVAQSLQAAMDVAGVPARVHKPCVRPVQVI